MSERVIAEVIAVGNELLSGQTINTNGAFLSGSLIHLGFDVRHQQVVGDDEVELMRAFRQAATRSSVILFCGGLGPTEDDLTKETVCRSLGLELEEHPEVVEQIRSYYEKKGTEMPENALKQAMLPKGCTVLQNTMGTAPGIYIQQGKQALVMLPGPPKELRPMFQNEVAPLLAQMIDTIYVRRVLGVVGHHEAHLENELKDLLYKDNPKAALYISEGFIQVAITATGETEEEAQQLVDDWVEEAHSRLGEDLFTTEGRSLPEEVVSLLLDNKGTVAVAEGVTAGMFAQELACIPGVSNCFEWAAVTYGDWTKAKFLNVDRALIGQYGGVSSVVTAEMARGARKKGKSTYGVAITGIAGPTRGNYLDSEVGTVYVAVCDKNRTYVRELRLGNEAQRQEIRETACMTAFDLLRRLLSGMEMEDVTSYSPVEIADLKRKSTPKTKFGIFARKTITSLLALAVLVGGTTYAVQTVRARDNRRSYTDLQTQYAQWVEESDSTEALAQLKTQNSQTAGWLSSEAEVGLSTVVLKQTETYYYDTHDFYGKNNELGSATIEPYVDLHTHPDNLVISASGSDATVLFGPLRAFEDAMKLRSNPEIYFQGENFQGTYSLFSVFYCDSAEGMDNLLYNSTFESDQQRSNFVVQTKLRSIFDVNTPLYKNDQFMTLVMDMDDQYEGCKLVVVGKRLNEGEKAGIPVVNTNVATLYPLAWYRKNGVERAVNISAESDKWLDWYEACNKPEEDPIQTAPEVTIRVSMNGEELVGTPLDIVGRMVAYEGEKITRPEALKALTVACATRLKYALRNNEELPELTGLTPSEDLLAIISPVINQVMRYENRICWTPTFLCSNGKTNSASEMLEEAFPHLVSVDSRYDYLKWNEGYYKVSEHPLISLKERIEGIYDIELSEDPKNWIVAEETTSIGTVTKVNLDGQVTVDAYEFFVENLSLPSANVSWSVGTNAMTFTIYGTGYGLGMSVYGAEGYASQQNWDYERVLQHYYTGVTIDYEAWEPYAMQEETEES